jgi:hypothetical protein
MDASFKNAVTRRMYTRRLAKDWENLNRNALAG